MKISESLVCLKMTHGVSVKAMVFINSQNKQRNRHVQEDRVAEGMNCLDR